MDDYFLNNKQLIAEVKKRPELYDVTNLNYYNRNNRDEKWVELFQVLVPHWHKLSPIEHQSYVLSIKKKWRSMRDSFAKDIRKRSTPSNASKSRRYIYFNQMKFILPSLTKRKFPDGTLTDTSAVTADNESSVESENDAPDETQSVNDSPPESSEDEDKIFLLSLLPLYKSMRKDSKLVSRIKMLEALRNVMQENSYDSVTSDKNLNVNESQNSDDCQPMSSEEDAAYGEAVPNSLNFSSGSLYYKLPAVWKINSPLYKSKEDKNKAYDLLVEKCKEYIRDADRDFVRNKINSLRSSFRKEYKKVKASQARDDGNVYVPNLWYFNLLTFTAEQDNEDCVVNLDESSAHSEGSFVDVKSEPACPFLLDTEDDPLLTPNEDSSPPPTKKHKTDHQRSTQNWIPVSPAPSTTSISDDIFEAIGKNVAHKLRRMAQQQRIIAEKIIGDVMYHGQMEMLTVKSHLALDQ